MNLVPSILQKYAAFIRKGGNEIARVPKDQWDCIMNSLWQDNVFDCSKRHVLNSERVPSHRMFERSNPPHFQVSTFVVWGSSSLPVNLTSVRAGRTVHHKQGSNLS